jgi:outer membrane protein insertion porin family
LFGGFVDHDQIDADVQTITDYYRAFGFYQAKVGRDIDFNENGTWATITFAINEGPRYEVRNVQFMGNQLFADSSLAMGIKMPAGHPFERAKMQADIEWLKELYGSQGYVFADIRAEPVLLEQPGQLDLVYHMEEGKRWRVGRVLVNVNGDHPHTRIQTALNRLSIEPGEVIDIREVRASERRLQASGLFLSDPISGTSPRITFQIPELDSVEFSAGRGPNDAGIRGQSPDAANRQQFAPPPMATTPAGAPPLVTTPVAAPPVIAPPSAAKHWHEISRPPAGNADDYVDIYIDVVTPEPVAPPATPPVVAPTPSEQTLSPSATIHTVMRPPYDQPVAYGTQITQPQYPVQQQVASQQYSPQQPYPAQQQYSAQTYPPQQQPQQAYTYAGQNGQPAVAAANSATPTPTQWPAPTQPAVASTWSSPAGGSNPYDNYTVRTQSPYQPAAATPQPPATTGFGGQAGYGVQAAYGGQVPGALGPQAAPVGHNGDVQQVQYTETLPPPGYGTQGDGPVMGAAGQTQGYSNQVVTPLPGDPVYPQGIPFAPVQAFPDPAVDVIVDVAEAPTGRFQIGAGINSDAGVVGTISLDERNFDWRKPPTSMNDFATGRAWRGGGQHLRLEAAPGTQVQRYLASWQEPYFLDTRVSFGLSGSFYERRFRDWDEERVGGRVSTGYQWVEHDLSASLAYRGENVNINDVPVLIPQLAEVLGDNALHGFSLRVANDTRDSAFFPTDGHLIDLQVEQVVGSFEYPRAILDIREYGLIRERPDHSGRHVISASSKIGYTGDDTPIYENFFAGGFSTLRGFDFRGASPVFMGVEVGGRFQWINTLEYLFPLTADDMMHGVVFVDFGTVESDIDELDIKRVRIAPGVGLRITVPAMGPAPIALDFAWGIERAATDDLQVFSFNVGYLR